MITNVFFRNLQRFEKKYDWIWTVMIILLYIRSESLWQYASDRGLEYKEVRKIEELAIVIDTSESCSGEYVRRFLEETFAILTNKDNFSGR